MSEQLIKRTGEFAVRIIKLVQSLPERDKVADVLGKQVLRSGTSIGANYRSALRGAVTKISSQEFQLLKKKLMKLFIG